MKTEIFIYKVVDVNTSRVIRTFCTTFLCTGPFFSCISSCFLWKDWNW